MVDYETVFNSLGVVVFSDDKLSTALIANAFDLGRIGDDVEGLAAVLAGSAADYLPETTPCTLNTRVGTNSPSL